VADIVVSQQEKYTKKITQRNHKTNRLNQRKKTKTHNRLNKS